jgi:hypothetical protein
MPSFLIRGLYTVRDRDARANIRYGPTVLALTLTLTHTLALILTLALTLNLTLTLTLTLTVTLTLTLTNPEPYPNPNLNPNLKVLLEYMKSSGGFKDKVGGSQEPGIPPLRVRVKVRVRVRVGVGVRLRASLSCRPLSSVLIVRAFHTSQNKQW